MRVMNFLDRWLTFEEFVEDYHRACGGETKGIKTKDRISHRALRDHRVLKTKEQKDFLWYLCVSSERSERA